jgi:HSP20 family protein
MTVFNVNSRPVMKSWNGIVNDLFNDFEKNLTQPGNSGSRVPVNIYEAENAFQLELVAPGRKKESFVLNIEKNILTISFDQKEEGDKTGLKTIRNEFSINGFKRSFSLDDKINTEAIEAKYEDGILKITLPKKEEVKPEVKQISIQ